MLRLFCRLEVLLASNFDDGTLEAWIAEGGGGRFLFLGLRGCEVDWKTLEVATEFTPLNSTFKMAETPDGMSSALKRAQNGC